jgi:hypothetical protein
MRGAQSGPFYEHSPSCGAAGSRQSAALATEIEFTGTVASYRLALGASI